MILSLIPIEFKKYKRTVMPWMIAAGGLLTVGTAMLMASTEDQQVNWEPFAARGLSCMNLLALLLVAVLTGFVFVGENSNNVDNMLFTYPVSRIRFFISKFIVLLLLTVSLYLVFFLFTMMFGIVIIGNFPSLEFSLKLLEFSLLLPAIHFTLVPVTTLVSFLVKGAGTTIFAGMAYFVVYISFINTDYSTYIPVCLPDKLAANYFSSGIISSSDILGMIAVCAITFISAFIIGAIYYSKHDVIK